MRERDTLFDAKAKHAMKFNAGLRSRHNNHEVALWILEHDLEMAAQKQRDILPEAVPVITGYDIGAAFKPAKVVGGDFYNFVSLYNGSMGFVVADVENKGLPAAMTAQLAQGMLHTILGFYRKVTPENALNGINFEMRHMDRENVSITMLIGELNYEKHIFKYARAGHERPMAFGRDGRSLVKDWKTKGGQPLNVLDEPDFDTGSFEFPPGGTVLLFTDGIADETDPDENMYGHALIARSIIQNPDLPAQDLCDRIMKDLELHRDGTPQYDDCTVIAIKRKSVDAGG